MHLRLIFRRFTAVAILIAICLGSIRQSSGEALLELFQQTWPEITAKMPEIAEAGYDAIYVPNPAKGNSGGYSFGYDVFDPFDLGSTNQQGTVATMYGTQAQLIQMVQTAHRFGIRVYFDNVMNHRASTVPGYPDSGIPTTYYPGLIPQDFHLEHIAGGYQSWSNISDWCDTWQVKNQLLEGLCDLAQEPGTTNDNFGQSLGATTTKPVFIRFPGRTDLYMDTNGAFLGAGTGTGWPSPANGYGPSNGWRPFDGHGQPVAEDVSTYLCRAVAWTLYMTGCDGFRLDAVKHVPVNFFGNETGQTDDPAFGGYTGAIQAMYDYVHGYGNNDDANGYIETDGNRNSCFNTEAPRNDAIIFGEYDESALAQGQDYYDYLNSGMRLLNFPLYNEFNAILGNYGGSPGMYGMDGRDYSPSTSEQGNCDGNGNFSPAQAVNMPQTQDPGTCCPSDQSLEDAYFFMHEGLPMVYSDAFNHNTGTGTPIVSYYNYLGEFGDNSGPDTMYTHNQLSRGGTWSRWSDQNVVLFERYDYREGTNAFPSTQAVALFAMNDDFGYPGDITFDDGVTRTSDGYYLVSTNTSNPELYSADIYLSNSRGVGIDVGFPPGTVLTQLSSSGDVAGGHRAYYHLLVHGATNSLSAAQASANDPNPVNRLIYVGGEYMTPGGGAVELVVPSGGWAIYGMQWPQASQNNPYTNAITLTQGGAPALNMLVYRHDGPDGDTNYDPLFPFKMRGSVDPYGNVLVNSGEGNVSNRTYAIEIPVITNGAFNILINSDGSTSNTLVKLDGGIDLNSQMGLGPTSRTGLAPTNFLDLRDNPPGYSDDVFLGYERTALQFRNGPEKFAADNVASNTVVSIGAEVYSYTVGGSSNNVAGDGYGSSVTNDTAAWVWHNPTNTVGAMNTTVPSQRDPLSPGPGESADVWIKIGYEYQINTAFIYYTTDGTEPQGAFGIGKGSTQVVPAFFINHDSVTANIDWWKGTIPAQANGTQVRYKVAVFNGGSYGFNAGDPAAWPSIAPMTNADPAGSKLFGLTQAAITNFNPTTAVVWYHDDLNPANTYTGLQSGFHIIRARTFLSRPGQSSVYNTFSQTFYYDGSLPGGVIASPSNGSTDSNQTSTIVIRGDSGVTEADVNIQDDETNSYDLYTGQANGISNDSNGDPVFVPAQSVTPNPTLSAVYPNYPQEFHLNFPYVPTNSAVTVTVHLKELTSSIYTNRFTTLTSSFTAAAPVAYINVANPSQPGQVVTLSSGAPFDIQACFTTNIPSQVTNFYIYVNGVFQPRTSNTNLYNIGISGCGAGLRMLSYNWLNPVMGTNSIEVLYSNTPATVVSAFSSVIITQPLRITTVNPGNQFIVWASAPNLDYQVLATTNLLTPFEPISGVIPSQGLSTFYNDYTINSNVPQKYYEIEVISSQ